MAQAVQFKLELGLLVLRSVGAQLCVLNAIAHQIELGFDVGDDLSLELVDLLGDSIGHSSDGLPQDGALTFNTLDLRAQLLSALGVLRRHLPTLALLAISLLILHLVRL